MWFCWRCRRCQWCDDTNDDADASGDNAGSGGGCDDDHDGAYNFVISLVPSLSVTFFGVFLLSGDLPALDDAQTKAARYSSVLAAPPIR